MGWGAKNTPIQVCSYSTSQILWMRDGRKVGLRGSVAQNFHIFSKKIFPRRGNSKKVWDNRNICDQCLVRTAMHGQKINHEYEIFYAVMMISGNITLSDGSGTLGENLSLGE